MNDIRKVIRAASLRLWLTDLMLTLTLSTTAVLVALLLARLVERVGGFALPWDSLFLAGAAAAVLGGVAWSVVRRRGEQDVARRVDEAAGLRESLSTALLVEHSEDAWDRAVIQNAQEKANGVTLSSSLPWRTPRAWPLPVVAGAALAVVWFTVPAFDLSGLMAEQAQEEQAQHEIREVKQEIKSQEDKLKDLLKNTPVTLEDLEPDSPDENAAGPDTPERLQKAQLRKLTDLRERLKQARQNEDAQNLESLRDTLRRLRQPGMGELDEMARQLARGNFKIAGQELEKLEKKLGDGSLTPEQQAQLKKQMENLAKQLEKLGSDRKELEEALKQSGMSEGDAKKLASNPDALKAALDQMQQLSPEQKQALMQQAQQMAQNSQQTQNMSQMMQQAAEGMQQQGMNQDGQQAMEDMSAQLSQMEQLAQEMESLDAAMSECDSQMSSLGQSMGGESWAQCEGTEGQLGEWQEGDAMSMGGGSGGPGRGSGGGPEEIPQDFMYERVKEKVATGSGPIIGTRYVYEQQIRGESQAEFATIIESSSQAAAEALDAQAVPREYHDAVKHYFGRLKKKVDAQAASSPAPEAE